jgi:hypothetical protein
MFDAVFNYLNLKLQLKIMDTETANTVITISTTVAHAWIMYLAYWWFSECAC